MITDETEKLQKALEGRLDEMLSAAWSLHKDFELRDNISPAVAEISEKLIAQYLGGTRTPRATKGYDVVTADGERVEVKSRFIDKWGDTLQFNFGKHTKDAAVAYCLAWNGTSGEKPHLERAFRVPVSILLEKWPRHNSYCARTTLGALKRSVGKPDAEGLSLTPGDPNEE
jgi:hypothetical protein